jgi:hypothetical protein
MALDRMAQKTMAEDRITLREQTPDRKFTGTQVFGIVLAVMILAIAVTVFVIRFVLFPGAFTPVVLSAHEETQLEKKLAIFEKNTPPPALSPQGSGSIPQQGQRGSLTPERYREEGDLREITFTERELNAMVAKNTNLAQRLAIDLDVDVVSLKLLIPLEPDLPMLGGKTLKVTAGVELAHRLDKPVVKLKGVSLMGVPLPNAWLGGLKDIDLIKEFGQEKGFWHSFSQGIKAISVENGLLKIQLHE